MLVRLQEKAEMKGATPLAPGEVYSTSLCAKGERGSYFAFAQPQGGASKPGGGAAADGKRSDDQQKEAHSHYFVNK
ncbi:hypothetical protein COOONC_12583 [Cooperia oncophora]